MDATQGRAPQDEVGDIFHNLESERSSIPETSMMESKGRGVLDTPLEPVIGLAEGETRWRSMTMVGGHGASAPSRKNGLLRNREPFRPYRQGSSIALVMPIRMPATISGLFCRACSAIGGASSARPLCLSVI